MQTPPIVVGLESITPSFNDPNWRAARPKARTLVWYTTSVSLSYCNIDGDGFDLDGNHISMIFVAKISDDGDTFVVRCCQEEEAKRRTRRTDELFPIWYKRVVENAFDHGKPVYVFDASKIFGYLSRDYLLDASDES